MGHPGILGSTPMSQEGSGTSWIPASSPHYAYMLPMTGSWSQHLMGTVFAGFVDAGGERGESQWYSNSMLMYMGRQSSSKGNLGLNVMVSLDPLTNGKRGVPDLFQTGETDGGKPLQDRQHPHDFVAEASVVGSKKLGQNSTGFLYVAPVGEPALGNSMFLHRPSGFENPEAPITHHWFDSTHISFGVVTAGLTFGDKWKVEASAFNGHEPDEDRYAIDPISLNSAAGRLTYNPTPDLSVSTSYGYLNEPEALEPGVDQHRLTASLMYNKPLNNGNVALALMFGRNIRDGEHSDAWNLEATYSRSDWSFYSRIENVDKDELVAVPVGVYNITKFVVGATRNIATVSGFEYGVGAYVGFYSVPDELKSFYGSSPVTVGAYLRIRPGRM